MTVKGGLGWALSGWLIRYKIWWTQPEQREWVKKIFTIVLYEYGIISLYKCCELEWAIENEKLRLRNNGWGEVRDGLERRFRKKVNDDLLFRSMNKKKTFFSEYLNDFWKLTLLSMTIKTVNDPLSHSGNF